MLRCPSPLFCSFISTVIEMTYNDPILAHVLLTFLSQFLNVNSSYVNNSLNDIVMRVATGQVSCTLLIIISSFAHLVLTLYQQQIVFSVII